MRSLIYYCLLLLQPLSMFAQNTDTLKVEGKCAIFICPEYSTQIKMSNEAAIKDSIQKINSDFEKFTGIYADSLNRYGIKIYKTISRYIEFPFFDDQNKNKNKKYIADTQQNLLSNKNTVCGMVWYGGKYDVIYIPADMHITTNIKEYFSR